MANKKGQDIYDLFSQELDGETFDSDADALREMNISYRNILGDRDWYILLKSSTLTAGTYDLSTITDLDKVIRVWADIGDLSTDRIELRKANFDQRFDESFDYWIDYANNEIKLIGDTNEYADNDLIVDYKYKPADLALASEIVLPDIGYPAIAYDMILAFKEKDTDPDFYTQVENKKEKAMDKLIQWNEELYAQS